jgi:hypothetical protein
MLAKIINQEFSPESVVDLGCGAGWVLYYLNSLSIPKLMGIEPNQEIKSVAADTILPCIQVRDLTTPLVTDEKFDLAISLEVAEHIDEQFSDIVISNICLFSDVVFFSAATPGQGGYGHVNEQTFDYWKQKFGNLGYEHDDTLSKHVRSWLKKKNVMKWYSKNINILRRG